jgi:hypothetical protein
VTVPAEATTSKRRTAILAVAAIVAIALGANITGLVPIPGGPVGVASPPGGFGMTLLPAGRAGTDGSLYTTLTLFSNWPVSTTLLSVTPALATAPTAVTVLGTHSNPVGGGLDLGAVADPGPGWAHPDPVSGSTIPTGGDPANLLLVLVKVSPTTVGDAAVAGFWLEYSVGPFRFRSFDETGIIVCAVSGTPSSYPDCST